MVTAYIITHTLSTNHIETVTGRLTHQPDGSCFVISFDRTVRVARGQAYLARSGALHGIRELVILALENRKIEEAKLSAFGRAPVECSTRQKLFAVPSTANQIDELNRIRFHAGQAARQGAITPDALGAVHRQWAAKEAAVRRRRRTSFELWLDQRGGL